MFQTRQIPPTSASPAGVSAATAPDRRAALSDRRHWSHNPTAYRRAVLAALRHPDTWLEALFALVIGFSLLMLGIMGVAALAGASA